MTKRMLIDATHAEETRVVVLDGNRLEDFDVEVASKKQLKGNIYLAKVIRVEPSLQAAFVEYGGGRHGFLAFSEIHPDYYQIPVADRQRLLAIQAEEARAAEAEEEAAEAAAERAEVAAPAAISPSVEAASVHDETEPPMLAAAEPALAHAPPVAPPEPVEPSGDQPDVAQDYEQPEVPPVAAEAAAPASAEIPAPVHETAPDPAPETAEPSAPVGVEPAAPPEEHAQEDDHFSGRAQPMAMARDEIYGPDIDAEPRESAPAAEMIGATPPTAPEPDAPAEAEAEQVTVSVEEPPELPPLPPEDAYAEVGQAPAPESAEADAARGYRPEPEPDAEEFGDGQPTTAFDIPDAEQPPPETIGGGDAGAEEAGAEEARVRRSSRLLRSYRIQEVIHRRQILLVQVVKEERGTKGAALTTYISLAGRFSVLMPNSPRGGGISRKITSAADRKRLREVTAELNLPDGMGLIVRTAGANRPKPEIKRDCEYLMRLWDDIREHTFRSVAPALIYEEASLIKRAIRDVYSRDIDEIVVDGEEGWRAAHDFMRMLMPSHARKVQLWRGGADGVPGQSLFAKYQVEAQLDAMMTPTVPLKSGGYLVINQTEALVAIDVNSGRSTRERNIEETALRTNLEAADEAARQLRLRDLAGLIVIDFIDMESRKHNAAVERRLKDALRIDRARIQVGSISHFGLLEMSRQRLRPSLAETNFEPCPHCGGTGHVRNIDSSAIHVLRAIEEEGARQKFSVVMVHASGPVVMYLLNHKRERLAEIERRFGLRVQFAIDDQLSFGQCRIDKVRGREEMPVRPASALPVVPAAPADLAEEDEFEDEPDETEDREAAPGGATAGEAANGTDGDEGDRRRRRRRRRRGGRRDGAPAEATGVEGGAGEPFEAAPSDEPDDAIAPELAFAAEEGFVGLTAPEPVLPPPAAPEATEAAEEAAEPTEVAARGPDDQPSIDPTELDENGLPKAGRRRGRRGGRRRRREGEGEGEGQEVAVEAEAPVLAPVPAPMPPPRPVYAGPTPADPFGAGFDIFDVIDTAAEVVPAWAPAPSAVVTPPAVMSPAIEEPPALAADAVESATEVATPAVPAPAPEASNTLEPPFADVPPVPVEAPEAAPHEAEATGSDQAREPHVAPPIQPVLIGSSDTPATGSKRGWWRR